MDTVLLCLPAIRFDNGIRLHRSRNDVPLGESTTVDLDMRNDARVIDRVLRSQGVPIDPHRNLSGGIRANMFGERSLVELHADRPRHVLSYGEWLTTIGLHLASLDPNERVHIGIVPVVLSNRPLIGTTDLHCPATDPCVSQCRDSLLR